MFPRELLAPGIVCEGISSATLWTLENAETQKTRTDQGLPQQGTAGTATSASNTNVYPSLRVNWLDDAAEIERPAVDAGTRV